MSLKISVKHNIDDIRNIFSITEKIQGVYAASDLYRRTIRKKVFQRPDRRHKVISGYTQYMCFPSK